MSRVLLRSLLALVLTAAAALIGWQVLGPAEVLATATAPYPVALVHGPGVTGRLNVAPLIVDGRIRVYGSKRQVRADAPVDAKTVYTARWSFRRWPQQLAGVVAIGPTVISRWSDGELVAIDGRTGEISWRTGGPSAPGYDGHRTGSATVWAPPGLHVAEGAVLVAAGRELFAYDVGTGTRRWRAEVPAACTGGFTTGGGQYVCATGAYDTATGSLIASWPAGPYTPLGCVVAADQCAAVRDGRGQGWLTDTVSPRRVAGLDRPGSTVADGLVIYPRDGALQVSTVSGGLLRTYPEALVLGASAGHLLLLTPDRRLVEVDPRAGTTLADFPLAVGTEKLTWAPGRWQVVDGHVAIERLAAGHSDDPDAPDYYFTVETVILAAV